MPAARKRAAKRPTAKGRDGKPFLIYLPDEQLDRLDAMLEQTGEARVSFARRAILKLMRAEAER